MNIITAAGIDSHLPVLRWAQEHSGDGSVLEFGGGMHSTAQLVKFEAEGFRTATIEADPEWRAWLKEQWPEHPVHEDMRVLGQGWGTVLIDHGEGEWAWIDARAAALEACRGNALTALVHDWHIGPGHRGELVESWPHHGWFEPEDGTMHTAICSEVLDVKNAEILGGRIYTSWDDAPEVWPN